MPKVDKKKTRPGPFNVNILKNSMKEWTKRATEFEKASSHYFDQIREYINDHADQLSSDQLIDSYDAISKGLDIIERKGTTKVNRLDTLLTMMIEDQNQNEVFLIINYLTFFTSKIIFLKSL